MTRAPTTRADRETVLGHRGTQYGRDRRNSSEACRTRSELSPPDDVRSTADRSMGPEEMSEYARSTEFDDELFNRVLSVVESGHEITTLSNRRPNRIVSIDRSGVSVETLRSDR